MKGHEREGTESDCAPEPSAVARERSAIDRPIERRPHRLATSDRRGRVAESYGRCLSGSLEFLARLVPSPGRDAGRKPPAFRPERRWSHAAGGNFRRAMGERAHRRAPRGVSIGTTAGPRAIAREGRAGGGRTGVAEFPSPEARPCVRLVNPLSTRELGPARATDRWHGRCVGFSGRGRSTGRSSLLAHLTRFRGP
jgi:hypothetical protein